MNLILFNGSTRLDNLLITISIKPIETIPFLGQINSLNALITVVFLFFMYEISFYQNYKVFDILGR